MLFTFEAAWHSPATTTVPQWNHHLPTTGTTIPTPANPSLVFLQVAFATLIHFHCWWTHLASILSLDIKAMVKSFIYRTAKTWETSFHATVTALLFFLPRTYILGVNRVLTPDDGKINKPRVQRTGANSMVVAMVAKLKMVWWMLAIIKRLERECFPSCNRKQSRIAAAYEEQILTLYAFLQVAFSSTVWQRLSSGLKCTNTKK